MKWLFGLISSVVTIITNLFSPTPTSLPAPTPTTTPIPVTILSTTSPTKALPTTSIKTTTIKPTATNSPSNTLSIQPTSTSAPAPTSTPIRISTTAPTSTKAPTPTTTLSGNFSVSTNNVNVTLSRAANIGGLVYGSGFTLTNGTAGTTGFCVIGDGNSGQGFYTGSGGISPGQSYNIQTYINTNKSNGTYSGSNVVKYGDNCSTTNGTVIDTVSYTITLTD